MIRGIALLLILSAVAFAADPADGVREASNGWREAAIKQDKVGLDRWLADDLSYAHSSGLTQNKAEYIAAVTKGQRVPRPAGRAQALRRLRAVRSLGLRRCRGIHLPGALQQTRDDSVGL